MDVYIGAATSNMNQGHDYLYHGVNMTDEQHADVDKLVGVIFGSRSAGAAEPAADRAKGAKGAEG